MRALPTLVLGCIALTAAASTAAWLLRPADGSGLEDLVDLAPIKERLAKIRGLDFKRPVPMRQQTPEAFGEVIRAELHRALPPERQEDMVAGLMRLGMLTEPLDLGESFVQAVISQAAARYDPETGSFEFLMTDMPVMVLEIIAAHELVHALQDQHFDLRTMTEDLTKLAEADVRDDDRVLAARCLIEGEATYVETLWQMDSMGIDLTIDPEQEAQVLRARADADPAALAEQMEAFMPEDGAMADALAAMDEIPPYILDPLYAAYTRGALFAMELRRAGGWEKVAEAYAHLPRSTEQVLHPAKFLTEIDEPTPIALPALPMLESDGWRRADAAIHGQLYLELMLRQGGRSFVEARRASVGWDGDVYGAWRKEGEPTIAVLLTTWDAEKDARQFAEALLASLEHRHSDLERLDDPEDDTDAGGRTVYATGADDGATGALIRRGNDVLWAEGADRTIIEAVMTALEAHRIGG